MNFLSYLRLALFSPRTLTPTLRSGWEKAEGRELYDKITL